MFFVFILQINFFLRTYLWRIQREMSELFDKIFNYIKAIPLRKNIDRTFHLNEKSCQKTNKSKNSRSEFYQLWSEKTIGRSSKVEFSIRAVRNSMAFVRLQWRAVERNSLCHRSMDSHHNYEERWRCDLGSLNWRDSKHLHGNDERRRIPMHPIRNGRKLQRCYRSRCLTQTKTEKKVKAKAPWTLFRPFQPGTSLSGSCRHWSVM